MRRGIFFIMAVLLVVASASATDSDQVQHTRTCGGEACDAVFRGFFAFFDRSLHGLDGNGRSCSDCHMPSDQFQLSPASAEARFQLLQERRRWNPRADDPLFRPIDADDFRLNGARASDFRNLRENGLVRIEFSLPPNMRLIDPATNLPSAETSVDVWRAVPTVNDVKLTGADGQNPWPRDPNRSGGYQLDGRFADLQEQALGALLSHAQVQKPPPQRMLDDLAAFQRTLFTNHRVRALVRRDRCRHDAARCRSTTFRARAGRQGRVRTRVRSMSWRPRSIHHAGARGGRYHDIVTQCPRPVDTVSPARFNFKPCPERLARNARTYEITLPNGTTMRRVSSDPGRALLTGVCRRTAAARRTGTSWT